MSRDYPYEKRRGRLHADYFGQKPFCERGTVKAGRDYALFALFHECGDNGAACPSRKGFLDAGGKGRYFLAQELLNFLPHIHREVLVPREVCNVKYPEEFQKGEDGSLGGFGIFAYGELEFVTLLVPHILNEEIEHESWFSEFLGEGPSGHFMRRGETSPFVGKFLR